MATEYNLVHITAGHEYKTPLVASQLFDPAELQAVLKEGFAPIKVQAWIISSFREYFDNEAKQKLSSLRKRCPDIPIKMINGINRLGNFPIMQLLVLNRRLMGTSIPVVYHCRGEQAAMWAEELKRHFPQDKSILDVRGFWAAESLYTRGIEKPEEAKGADLEEYKKNHATLARQIAAADGITTVSDALRELLINEMNAPANTYVVPCCINKITDDSRRKELRESMGIAEDEIAVVYSGTTAAYQHLDDLTIPFLKTLSQQNNKVRLVFFSSEHEKIAAMLEAAGLGKQNVIIKSFPQHEVAAALTACDAGILIRKPTLVNRVANPVKIAEYLAAGLPIIIEKNVGGVSKSLFEESLLKGIEISLPGSNMTMAAQGVNEWLEQDLSSKRERVRNYARKFYYWPSAIQTSRELYAHVLNSTK